MIVEEHIIAQMKSVRTAGIFDRPTFSDRGPHFQIRAHFHQSIEDLVAGPDVLDVARESRIEARDAFGLVVPEHVALIGIFTRTTGQSQEHEQVQVQAQV